jgi:hypothetical protein
MGSESSPAGLAELLAEREIRQVLLRYARGVDRMDEALVRSAFAPDATIAMGGFDGGLDAFVALIRKLVGRLDMTMHYLTNVSVEFSPTDTGLARTETYGFALQRSAHEPPKGNLITGFRYLDDLARRDGRWLITRRVTVSEWARVDDLAGQWPLAPGTSNGARDGSDLVFRPWTD